MHMHAYPSIGTHMYGYDDHRRDDDDDDDDNEDDDDHDDHDESEATIFQALQGLMQHIVSQR